MLGLFVLYGFNSIVTIAKFISLPSPVEPQSGLQSSESKFIIVKSNGSREYVVRLTFSSNSTNMRNLAVTATTTEKNDNDTLYYYDDNEPDSINFICEDVEFECADDQSCIPLDSYCDGIDDCNDKSDELMCAATPTIHFSIINETTCMDAQPIAENNSMMIILILAILIFICSVYFAKNKYYNSIVNKN